MYEKKVRNQIEEVQKRKEERIAEKGKTKEEEGTCSEMMKWEKTMRRAKLI